MWTGPYMSGYMWMFPILGFLIFIMVLLFLVQIFTGRGLGGIRPIGYLEEELEELKKEIRALREEIKKLKEKE